MKKSLVITLALVFVLGIAGTAFAANPFTDVPANHWAYASVSKLAQAGIIEGYGDGRYIGQSNITRYEMAQIVAKAMARSDKADASLKAQIEKLAAEFADELDSLGVRVAKLEKNADNVKITGEIRIANHSYDKTRIDPKTKKSTNDNILRTRLWLNGQVNDNWKYVGMIEHAGQDFRTNENGSADATTNLRRAWVDGNIGLVNVVVGRFAYAPVYGTVFDEDADGIKIKYSADNWKVEAFALRPTFTNPDLMAGKRNQVFGGLVNYNNNKLDATGAYYHTDAKDDGIDMKANIYELALGYRFNQDFKVWAEYLRGSKDINDGGKSGWAAGIDFGQANRNKPGSFNIRARYYDVPAAATINTTPELDLGSSAVIGAIGDYDGYKGYQIGATYMAAKNIDINVDWFDFDHQNKNAASATKKGDQLLFSYVRFYF